MKTQEEVELYIFAILDACIFDQFISKESAVFLLEGYQDHLLKLIFNDHLRISSEDLCKILMKSKRN